MTDAPHPSTASPDGDVAETFTPVYSAIIGATYPIVRGWGRMRVTGLEHVARSGPLLILGSHDSYWDPVAIGGAARGLRQIRALSKSSMWGNPVVGWVLTGMGQIPIERGTGDTHALDTAIAELRAGACIGVFPEGTLSRGVRQRPRSGAGRLVQAVPETTVVAVAVTGTVDVIRAPKRPRITVDFFPPRGGRMADGEDPGAFVTRVTEEIRERAPIQVSGRKATAAKQRRIAAAKADGTVSEAQKHRSRVEAGGGVHEDAGDASQASPTTTL